MVTVKLRDDVPARLHWNCSNCSEPCLHVGSVFAMLLEDKMTLGLAAPPKDEVPVEMLDEKSLLQRALADRLERSKSERMQVKAGDKDSP